MSQPVLRLEHVVKDYGPVRAVDDVSLTVWPGECFGFLGPNGAGKTTTIGMVLGLLHPTAGRIEVLGRPVTPRHTVALREVGALVGAPAFYPYLSGRAHLDLLRRLYPDLPPSRVDEVLEQVGLPPQAARRPVKTYSTGMRQRLGLAAALLHRPRLLVLDEPTNGLDPIGMAEMRALLRQLAEGGMAVFLSSHLLHEVQQVCDRVGILHRGRLQAVGPVDELLQGHRDLEEVFFDTVAAASPARPQA